MKLGSNKPLNVSGFGEAVANCENSLRVNNAPANKPKAVIQPSAIQYGFSCADKLLCLYYDTVPLFAYFSKSSLLTLIYMHSFVSSLLILEP